MTQLLMFLLQLTTTLRLSELSGSTNSNLAIVVDYKDTPAIDRAIVPSEDSIF